MATGGFAPVRAAVRRDGLRSAIKIVARNNIDAEGLRSLRNEAQLLEELKSPHIVKLHGWYEEPDAFYTAVELCDGERGGAGCSGLLGHKKAASCSSSRCSSDSGP